VTSVTGTKARSIVIAKREFGGADASLSPTSRERAHADQRRAIDGTRLEPLLLCDDGKTLNPKVTLMLPMAMVPSGERMPAVPRVTSGGVQAQDAPLPRRLPGSLDLRQLHPQDRTNWP
jgi:hypothetical protein